jgi:16S rRNA (cytosine1402-N4)-methyltransferase
MSPRAVTEMSGADQSLPDHVPVLLDVVLEYLSPQPGETIVDATVGLGGHAAAIAPKLGNQGRLIAIDQDASLLERAATTVSGCRVEFIHGNFANLRAILDRLEVALVDGLLADLGVASPHLDDPDRGFSFRTDGPLDMRMDRSRGEPAGNLIARLPEHELARIVWEYGEERFSRRIARRIVEERERTPISTTAQLAAIVREVVAGRRLRGRRPAIDPATRTFQALRIAVNDELGALDALLADLPRCIRPGGRVVVISFHSLEDRRVKQALRDPAVWRLLTAKPVRPNADEIARNARARSARLRAAQRHGNGNERASSPSKDAKHAPWRN